MLSSNRRKGATLRTAGTILTAVGLVILAGCNGAEKTEQVGLSLEEGKELLSVDFQEGRTLRYRFVSSRDISIDWSSMAAGSKRTERGENNVDRLSESLEMVVAYTPVKVEPYGLTVIEATCKSVKVTRSQSGDRKASKDAVESLRGKSFTFTVRPNGKIEDHSQLDELIKEIGKEAFREHSRQGRVKEPDMIGDVVASQWFLWDSISSIERPFEGVSVGESWKSKLSVPTPMVMREARDVTYTLGEIRQTGKGRIAVIRSSYLPSESVPSGWPVPYTGRFHRSGPFGLLGYYQMLDLQGEGEELFNIDAGRIEEYSQRYRLEVSSSLIFRLPGVNPKITVEQQLRMLLMD